MSRVVVAIYTCDKHVERMESVQYHWASKLNCPYFFVYGNGDDYKLIDNLLHLPCPDAYELLPLKTFHLLRYMNDIYKDYDYIIKVDDDSYVDPIKIHGIDLSADYSGFMIDSRLPRYNWHIGKCNDKRYETPRRYVLQHDFAPGGGYYLSSVAVKYILDNIIDEEGFQPKVDDSTFCAGAEDRLIGKTLSRSDLSIKSSGKWYNRNHIYYSVFNDCIFHPVKSDEMSNFKLSATNPFKFSQIVSQNT